MTDLASVETPVGCVDLDRARRNAARVVAYATEHGLAWRPHIKTHKSRRVASIQLEEGAQGLTVATPREAEVMATLTDDLLLAYPPVGDSKVARVVELAGRVDLKVALDSEEVARTLSEAASAAGVSVGILAEQDVGMGRVGLPTSEAVVALARTVDDLPGVEFRGVMFYPGHIRMGEGAQGEHVQAVNRDTDETLSALRAAGLDPAIVSGGSTPTLRRSHEMEGLTEIRSGSCIYYDREALDVGVAGMDDMAYTVLATVVSTAVAGHAVVDAGSKALSKEARGAGGYGVLVGRPEVQVVSMSEEHGILDLSDSDWQPQIGERVQILPNHVCLSVNLQDAVLGLSSEAEAELIPLEGRGRGPWTG